MTALVRDRRDELCQERIDALKVGGGDGDRAGARRDQVRHERRRPGSGRVGQHLPPELLRARSAGPRRCGPSPFGHPRRRPPRPGAHGRGGGRSGSVGERRDCLRGREAAELLADGGKGLGIPGDAVLEQGATVVRRAGEVMVERPLGQPQPAARADRRGVPRVRTRGAPRRPLPTSPFSHSLENVPYRLVRSRA